MNNSLHPEGIVFTKTGRSVAAVLTMGLLASDGITAELLNRINVDDVTRIEVVSKYGGWVNSETNLTLLKFGSYFSANKEYVPEEQIEDLLVAVQKPAQETIDAANLGLSPEWLSSNRSELLNAFGGEPPGGIFPRASERQRAWLTNALFDAEILNGIVGDLPSRWWTDDFPYIKLSLYNGDDEVVSLESRAQIAFMVPWKVALGDEGFSTYEADISRAVASVLPDGFLNRHRIAGNLLEILQEGFGSTPVVSERMREMVLEETLGSQIDEFNQEFELKNYRVTGGNYRLYPGDWAVVLHGHAWPTNLTMPISGQITNGIAVGLKELLLSANGRVQPILDSEWLSRLLRERRGIEIRHWPGRDAKDNRYLRGHMEKVGLGEFYDRIRPMMEEGISFSLSERVPGYDSRSSSWIIGPDGRMAIYSLSRGGVLDWEPHELGYRGDATRLRYISGNIGVLLTPDGEIDEVVARTEPGQ